MTSKCYPLFAAELGADGEVWATAWAMGMGTPIQVAAPIYWYAETRFVESADNSITAPRWADSVSVIRSRAAARHATDDAAGELNCAAMVSCRNDGARCRAAR
jgi:hypothetical protein